MYTEYYVFQLPSVFLSTDVIYHYLFLISAASLCIGPHPTNTCGVLSRGSSRWIKTMRVHPLACYYCQSHCFIWQTWFRAPVG